MDNYPFIIGFTGSFGSGCTTSAAYLGKSLGFKYISLSKILENQAKEKELPFKTRKDKQKAGNKLREKYNKEFLAKKAEEEFNNNKNVVIECFRNDGEVKYFQSKYPNFYLITIYAPKDLRWQRKKDEYKGNELAFENDDKRDQKEDDPYGQQIKKCVSLSDIVIINNQQWTTPQKKDEFYFKLDRYVKLLKEPNRAPTHIELNMHVAYSVSLMSSCIQRQVGAVITTPDYSKIISWGYNEVPMYSKPCHTEYKNCFRAINKASHFKKLPIKFCPFCGIQITAKDLFSDDRIDVSESSEGRAVKCKSCKQDLYAAFSHGKELDLCRSLHAEENAILQNVSMGGGISLRAMVLYTTTFPCFLCAKKIVNAGIKEVIYVEPYPIQQAMEILLESKIKATEFEGVKAQAFYKIFKERNSVLNKNLSPILQP